MNYLFPQTIAEAGRLAKELESTTYAAGGTDLMVRRELGLNASTSVIDLTHVDDLRGIDSREGFVSVGATTTLESLASTPITRTKFPALCEAALSIASPTIRGSATVAGNLLCENRCVYYDQSELWQSAAGGCLKCGSQVCVATGSAKHCYSVFISDLAPVLIVLDAKVELFRNDELTSLPVEQLYSGEGLESLTISRQAIVTRILIPDRPEASTVFFQKHRPRASVDFTNLTVAMRRTTGGVSVAASGLGPAPAVLKNADSENTEQLAAQILKQSRIIDNLAYRRTYRKELLVDSIARGLGALPSKLR